MKTNILFRIAFNKLTESEKRLIVLLTDTNTSRTDVLDFLNAYDIENEKASNTFLINDLLERFDLLESDNDKIPRIKGVKEFYRFHNINAMRTLENDTKVFDVDLYLRLKNKDTIRPFILNRVFLDERELSAFYGKRYIKKYLGSLTEMKAGGISIWIPSERYFADLLYECIYHSIIYKMSFNYACYVYDVFRYVGNEKISAYVYVGIIKSAIRHLAGKVIRWILA